MRNTGRDPRSRSGRARATDRRVGLVAAVLLLASPAAPRAQGLPELLKGRWTAGGDCQAGFTLQLAGNLLRVTDAAGHVDTQQVVSRRAAGIATRTIRSTHGQATGATFVYEVLGRGQISRTEGSTGRSADLVRCPDPLPANATPRQMLEGIYARYAKDDEPNLPLANEANLRAVFVADLADAVVAFLSRSGRVPDECRLEDPFVPGSPGRFKISRVQVEVPEARDGTDHVTAHVALRNFDKPMAVVVTLDRTPLGWRIADTAAGAGRSFRAMMSVCAAPVN